MPSREVNIQVHRKHALEFPFKTKLRKFFRKMAGDVRLSLSVVRQPMNLAIYQPELVSILREHYRLTSNSFLKIGQESLAKHLVVDKGIFDCFGKKVALVNENKIAENQVQLEVNNNNNQRSDTQASIILHTTERVLSRSIERVNSRSIENGETLSNDEFAALAAKDFNASNFNRVETIAVTETQMMSEGTKETQAVIVGGALLASGIFAASKSTKTWNSILDEKTRKSHVTADLQTVKTSEVFIVQAQRLNFPGDTSMGATMDNIAGCRCVGTYSIG